MDLIVCIKQVPDTQEVKVDFAAGVIKRDGVPLIVNPFDEYALEEAVRLKEKLGGRVTVLTMGPPAADEALRTALAMGCDAATLLSDPAFEGADTWATATLLSRAIAEVGPADTAFFGKETFDGATGAVAGRVAALLGWPMLNFVAKIEEVDVPGRRIKVERLLEDGRETVEASLPAVIAVVKEINEPRYPSLMGMRKARKVEIATRDAASLGLAAEDVGAAASYIKVARLFPPPAREGGEVLTGEAAEAAARLAAKLMEGKII